MMMKNWMAILVIGLLFSCNTDKSDENQEKDAKQEESNELTENELVSFLDSSLQVMREGKIKGKEANLLANQYIGNAIILSNKYTENEKAAFYLDKAGEIAWQFQQNAGKAIKIFNQVIQKFPDYEDAEKVYYFKAVILDLDLRKKEQALTAYQELLDRFPNTQYKDDATFRMENIDLSEEEMIKKAMADQEKEAA